MHELISVVITTYSRTDALKRAIDSVLQQTYKNIEIIVVDDNCDINIKNTVKEIVQSYKNCNIRLLCNSYNMGGALSRNEGIKASNSNYIAFLDDDDEYLPEKLRLQYDLFKNTNDSNLALVYGYCREIKDNGTKRDYKYDYSGNCIYEAMLDCIAATSQWMCKKNALINVGMFSDVPCKQDSTVIIKLLLAGYTINRVPELLSIYHTDQRIRISGKGHEKRIIGEEMLRNLCRENYSFLNAKEQREVEYSFALRLAEHYKAIGDKEKYGDCMNTIVRTHPVSFQTIRAYKRVFFNISSRRKGKTINDSK